MTKRDKKKKTKARKDGYSDNKRDKNRNKETKGEIQIQNEREKRDHLGQEQGRIHGYPSRYRWARTMEKKASSNTLAGAVMQKNDHKRQKS